MPPSLPMLKFPLRRFVDELIFFRSTPPEIARTFAEHAQNVSIRLAWAFLIAGVFAAIAWWPTDYFLFAEHPEVIRAFAHMRIWSAVLAVPFLVGVEKVAFVRRYLVCWWTLFSCLFVGQAAWFIGGVSTPQSPANSAFILVPALSLLLAVPIMTRMVVTFCIFAAFVACFFLAHPSNLLVPGASNMITNMFYSVLLSIAMGHGLYSLIRTSFLQRRELDELSASLARKVEEGTAELRQLARHIEELRETERAALARELHDELGQCLSAMRVELNLAERRQAGGGDVVEAHTNLNALLDRTFTSMRSLLNGLRPRVLDDLGVVAALELLVLDVGRRAGARIDFRCDSEDLETSPEVGIVLFRIAQEALTNVVRHAEAGAACVELKVAGDRLLLSIADDGKGIESGRRSGSMGLLGMRERAAAVNGRFEVMPNAPSGTIVRVDVPYRPAVLSRPALAAEVA